jgi:hypothetical protein
VLNTLIDAREQTRKLGEQRLCGQLDFTKAQLQLITHLDDLGTVLEQCPQGLCVCVLGLTGAQLLGLVRQKACQQPGVGGIGFIALVNDFPVMGQLAWIDEVDLEAVRQCKLDPAPVIVRGGLDCDPYRTL